MSALLLVLALQATPAAPVPPRAELPPQRFSILVDPCASRRSVTDEAVVVCGRPEQITPRLAMPHFRGVPDHATPSNPEMSAAVALNGPKVGTECGAYGENCPGIANGQALPALVNGAVGLLKDTFRKKPDKRGWVPIPLDDPPPPRAQ